MRKPLFALPVVAVLSAAGLLCAGLGQSLAKTEIPDQATAAAMRGIALDSLLNVVDLAESRDEFAGSEKHLRMLFGGFFRRPVVSRLYEETQAPLK